MSHRERPEERGLYPDEPERTWHEISDEEALEFMGGSSETDDGFDDPSEDEKDGDESTSRVNTRDTE